MVASKLSEILHVIGLSRPTTPVGLSWYLSLQPQRIAARQSEDERERGEKAKKYDAQNCV
jgi:hypothetical protein